MSTIASPQPGDSNIVQWALRIFFILCLTPTYLKRKLWKISNLLTDFLFKQSISQWLLLGNPFIWKTRESQVIFLWHLCTMWLLIQREMFQSLEISYFYSHIKQWLLYRTADCSLAGCHLYVIQQREGKGSSSWGGGNCWWRLWNFLWVGQRSLVIFWLPPDIIY